MKRKRILLCILCSVLFLFSISALTVYAHPGRLDSNGGHNDYINGGYHYHTGDNNTDFTDHQSEDFFLEENLHITITCVCILTFCLIIHRVWRQSTKPTPNATAPPSSSPRNSQPPSKEFSICHTIWLCTYHISRHCAFTNRPFAQGHIWATLFYIVAKHIRNQTLVDQIYSHFIPSASDIGMDDPYPERIASLVQHGYREFVPILNASGIDPRTSEGIQQLWELIKKEDFKHKDPHPSATQAYFDYTQILISNIATYRKSDSASDL